MPATSWPRAARWIARVQPRYPSTPVIRTRMQRLASETRHDAMSARGVPCARARRSRLVVGPALAVEREPRGDRGRELAPRVVERLLRRALRVRIAAGGCVGRRERVERLGVARAEPRDGLLG